MNWIDIAWPMMGAAGIVLALIHLAAWTKRHRRAENLVFAILCIALAVIAIFELLMMHARTTQQYGDLLRWIHVPVTIAFVCIVVWVRLHFRAGNLWLAAAAITARCASIFPAFLSGSNLNYLEITHLDLRPIWGGGGALLAIPKGIPNPWANLQLIAIALLIMFLISMMVAMRRRAVGTESHHAHLIGISLIIFLVISTLQTPAVVRGWIDAPVAVIPTFMIVVLVMSTELGGALSNTAKLIENLNDSRSNLRETNQRMHLAIHAAGIGLWYWNMESDQVWFSDVGARMHGFALNTKPRFADLLERVHPADREALREVIEAAVRDKSEFESEYRVIAPDGNTRWIAARGQVAAQTSRSPARFSGIAIDISSRKRMQMESAQQRDELAYLSRVTMMSELAASLAHELNQPLTAILSNAQAAVRFLAHTPPALDEVRESLASVVENDKRAGEIIKRLRAMLRKDSVDFVRLHINDVIEDVLKLLESDLLRRNVMVNMDLATHLPTITGDRIQLQQVIMNLVMNGCDAMMEMPAGREITLRSRAASPQGVEVSVSDAGHGVSPDRLEHIFTTFVSSKPHGMGLGLAISKSIIQAHHGRLWASNTPLGGASFSFFIPAHPGG